jgi:hypothetical protein
MGSEAAELLEPHPTLAPFHDQLRFHPPAAPGLRGRAARWARRLAHAALRPWLERQTAFNQKLIDLLAGYLREMDRRQQLTDGRLAQQVTHYDQKLAQQVAHLQSRVADVARQASRTTQEALDTLRETEVAVVHRTQALEARHADRLERLEQQLRGAELLPNDGRVSLGVLDVLFFQTRLPAPPARLLTTGLEEYERRELAALGFAVESEACDAAVLRGAADELAATLASVSAQLRAGACVILSIPGAQPDWAAPAGYTLRETRHAVRRAAGYCYSDAPDDAAHTWVVLERD